MVVKFTIPRNAIHKYPVGELINEQVDTNSWFDFRGCKLMYDRQPTQKLILRCEKINIYPTSAQRKLLIEWFDLYRYTYNQSVKYIKSNKLESFYTMRRLIKDLFPAEIKNRIKLCGVPVHTIDNAVKDAVSAYKSSLALHKGKRLFRIRYKKEKANQIITLENSAFSKRFNSFSKKLGVVQSNKLFKLEHDCKLSYRNGNFILYTPVDKPVMECLHTVECCSLDPGLRTFQTIYCNNGNSYKIGNNVTNKLAPLMDKLKDGKSKYKRRIRDKIKHLVDDLHWKSANILCKLSDKILIGNMSTRGVLQGNLQSKTKNLLQCLSHYTFRHRLKAKCEEYGVQFIEADESYTSKTCGQCGKINNSLGSNKIFNCPCGFHIDRDVNGARNIMIKCLQ